MRAIGGTRCYFWTFYEAWSWVEGALSTCVGVICGCVHVWNATSVPRHMTL